MVRRQLAELPMFHRYVPTGVDISTLQSGEFFFPVLHALFDNSHDSIVPYLSVLLSAKKNIMVSTYYLLYF